MMNAKVKMTLPTFKPRRVSGFAALLAMTAAMSACSEPYSTGVNADADPAIETLLLKDTLGTTELAPEEEAAFDNSAYDPAVGGSFFPTSYIWFRSNKLLEGETIEQIGVDELTGKELSQCHAVPGGVTVSEAGADQEFVRACYNPGTRIITAQIADETYTPRTFLNYATDYVFSMSSNITDKRGVAFPQTDIAVRTTPFQLLSVTTTDFSSRIFAAAGSSLAFADGEGPADVIDASSGQFRFLFSGPMHGTDGNEETPTFVAVSSFAGARLVNAADDTEVTALDAEGNEVHALFDFQLDPETPLASDPRIIFMVTPQALVSEDGTGTLPLGDYRIELPATVSDDGSVTGTPVTVAEAIVIPFKVIEAPPEEEEQGEGE